MNHRTLVTRSLRYYWRTHLGVVAGAALATTIVVGALGVGDSVRFSLGRLAAARLGRIAVAVTTGERFARAQLAADLAAALPADAAALVVARGSAVSTDGARRAAQIEVLGVDARFWALADPPAPDPGLGAGQAAVNARLAAALGLAPGAELVVRLERPSLLPREAPLATAGDQRAARRLAVRAVVGDDRLGGFALANDQRRRPTLFVDRQWLAAELGVPDRANLMLLAPRPGQALDAAAVGTALNRQCTLADLGLDLAAVPGRDALELRSARVFLEPSVAAAALAPEFHGQGTFTYLVNELRYGERTTPYSFVAASGAPLVPADLADDELVVNDWLAADLAVPPGATVTLRYWVIGPYRQFTEQRASFRVRGIVPLAGPAGDPALLPAFPGLADVDNCRDWHAGVPLDLSRIRLQDEEYWRQHRGTPKAFVTLAAAQRLWGNRYGSLTAVRYPGGPAAAEPIARHLRARLSPVALGFQVVPVRELGQRAAGGATDFGQLFLGLSFFIMLAALLLTAMLGAFSVEQRQAELGVLRALGFTAARVRALLGAEIGTLVLAGALLGLPGGIIYNELILWALRHWWAGAVGPAALAAHLTPGHAVAGVAAGLAAGLGTTALVVAAHTRRVFGGAPGAAAPPAAAWRRRYAVAAAVLAVAGSAVLALAGPGRGQQAAAAFMSGGGLLFVAGLLACLAWLSPGRAGTGPGRLTVARLARRQSTRRRLRSLGVVALLACGMFVLVAVSANRRDPRADARRRASGTGGFAFVGETAIPLVHDPGTPAGQRALGLDPAALAGVRVLPLRRRDGDDASCLNLNRAQRPALLGVDPQALAALGAFAFVGAAGPATGSPWRLLETPPAGADVAAIADQTVIEWGLGRRLGDTLEFSDEQGRPFRVRLVAGLANSIFQGHLLIADAAFRQRFPSTSGARFLLVDVPPGGDRPAVAQALTAGLGDYGLELTPAAERLAEFATVENTYLSIFQALGGLGLLLGTAGLGIVVLRNALERRRELALLRAVGYDLALVRRLLFYEHALLAGLGLGGGTLTALVAVWPALTAAGGAAAWPAVLAWVLVLGGAAAAWTALAVIAATRGPLLDALRHE